MCLCIGDRRVRCRTRGCGGSPLPPSTPRFRRHDTPFVTCSSVNKCPSDDLVDGLLLIVSELVTNAVRHAALLSPMLAVEVAVGAEWVRVSVEDNHPYRPTALEADQRPDRWPWAAAGAGGRPGVGWGDVEHTTSGGKVIWAALPLTPSIV